MKGCQTTLDGRSSRYSQNMDKNDWHDQGEQKKAWYSLKMEWEGEVYTWKWQPTFEHSDFNFGLECSVEVIADRGAIM